MTVKEQVTQGLEGLTETELQQMAEYLAFLKFRARARGSQTIDVQRIGALYEEFAEDDRALAEAGMTEYAAGLLAEDAR